jgi:hypothetical protein
MRVVVEAPDVLPALGPDRPLRLVGGVEDVEVADRGVEDLAAAEAASVEDDDSPPYRSFIEEHRPQLRFHYRAIEHLLEQILLEESRWDAFFEHSGIKPVLVLYENFAADYETSTLRLLERLDLSPPQGFDFEPRMKRQSDLVNDDWVKRYSELRLGTDFDLVPAKA